MLVYGVFAVVFLTLQDANGRSIEARSAFSSYQSNRNSLDLDVVPALNLVEHEVRSISLHNVRDLSSITVDLTNDYGLRNSESFYWGRYGYPLANFTAHEEGEHVKVLSMERFGATLSKAVCSSKSVVLTFPNKSQFDEVKEEWSWVNSAADNYIVLVTESARCNTVDDDPGERQPWHVSSASFDPASYTVTFIAKPKSWEEAFNDWHLTVKTRGILPTGTKVKREHPTLSRRYEISGSPSINLTTDIGDIKLKLGGESIGGAEAYIECSGCGTSGNLDFEIDVIPWLTPLPPHLSGTLSIIGNDIGAFFDLDIGAEVPLAAGANGSDTIWSMSPPDVGLSIMVSWLKLNLAAGIGKTTLGFKITTGVDIDVLSGSILEIDFDDSANNEDSGWNPSFTPKAPSMSGSVEVVGNIAGQFIAEFGGTILGIAAEAGVMLATPTLGLSAEAISGTNVCDEPGAGFGVELGINYGGAIDSFEIASLAEDANIGATQTLVATTIGAISTCITVVKGSVAPSASFTPSAPALSSVPLFTITPSGTLSSGAASSKVPRSSSIAASISGSSTNVASSSIVAASSSSLVARSSSIADADSSSDAASASIAPRSASAAPSDAPSSSAAA